MFTYKGAIEVFKIFVERCYKELTLESSAVLSDVSADMHKIGFDWDEIEKLEIETIRDN